MHKRRLTKPDGRALILYARQEISGDVIAPSPQGGAVSPNAHLRWHPLRGEWVAYAGHRQNRTFLPPPEYNPLASTSDPANPTEVPSGNWDVAVFENLFPTLTMKAHDPPSLGVATEPGKGVCEVVVFTQDAKGSLGRLPLWHIELLVDVWADRYTELGAVPEVQYVYPFENRGVEVGVTLHHPHGQLYAYPFVPPVPARELAEQRAYYERHGRGLLEDFIARELSEGVRILYDGPQATAFMPICARYSYEVWVAPKRAAVSFAALSGPERRDCARALKTVLMKFDALWQKPFPYILAFHQAPTDGGAHPEAHLHAEFYPAYRMPGRLKYLAGSEIGAGVFTADTLPEQKAEELKAVVVDIDA
ncbi:MAG TPA: galactose-1-phosphate uridylyltransferase [Vicinamibacterales bacterium]|jgi:UDPglucose--hexose-1-phosphate uridylyltransferase|nr:galactose-1-phosphate uridylyltransferase [Vicinamibacterales bacterium]